MMTRKSLTTSSLIALGALGLSQSAYSTTTIQSYWSLGEGASLPGLLDSSSVNDGTLNPFNNTADVTFNTGEFNAATDLTYVPEPSAALLGSLGMLALLRRRRRG